MTIRLYNTPTREIETFQPQSNNTVLLYTCGPTVYNHLHIGNWIAYIYWDTLVRMLIENGYTVNRVMNITDVGHLASDEDEGEDKLQKGAEREGKTAWEVAKFYTDDFLQGMEKLNFIIPQHITRATDYIEEQLALVRTLKEKGFTYQIDDGIYYDTSKFPTYANFAHLNLAAQEAGARVAYNTEKRNPSDFALWKFSPSDAKRDMEWETPQDLLDQPAPGPIMGFPGWHLECSAMAMSLLGDTIDIHTGGIDHIPVHHTNEIAQSEGARGVRFSNYWLHNNHLKANDTKISKSLGNGYTLQDLSEKGYDPMDYRMFALQSHYRNEGNFSFENLDAAKHRLHNWRKIAALRHQLHPTLESDVTKVHIIAAAQAILEQLNNDLDTPGVLSLIDEVFSTVEVRLAGVEQDELVAVLERVDALLGLNLLASTPDITDETKQLLLERRRAREAKDWQRSDDLRDELAKQTIGIQDTPAGSFWYYL